jgi:copper chaperone CopZ
MKTETLAITGMTCSGCEYKVQHLLGQIPGVAEVVANWQAGEITVKTDSPVPIEALVAALAPYPKYQIQPLLANAEKQAISEEKTKTWLQTYAPLLILFAYLVAVASIVQMASADTTGMVWMRTFMAGFFLAFSFFKLINLKGFADSYAMYDVVAKRWPAYGFMYPFVELGLGLAYALNYQPAFTNGFTFVLMSVSLAGVVQAVFTKRKIACACLGAVFDLPMSTVTIIEDLLMVLMAGGIFLSLL